MDQPTLNKRDIKWKTFEEYILNGENNELHFCAESAAGTPEEHTPAITVPRSLSDHDAHTATGAAVACAGSALGTDTVRCDE